MEETDTRAPLMRPVRYGVVGCGDVAFRSYLPAFAASDAIHLVATCDPVAERARRAAAASPGARPYTELQTLLADPDVEAVIDLTPALLHGGVNREILAAGKHLLTEKPMAGSVAEADELIALARARGIVLASAPAILVAPRVRWLRAELERGTIGRPTLAVAQMATMGPAFWREYTGDPAVFYRRAVGPVIDLGVYTLTLLTGLFGPARRVQAMVTTAIPERVVPGGPHAGRRIAVEGYDHALIHLELAGGVLAQVLASFAVPATQMPSFEIIGSTGTFTSHAFLTPRAGFDLFTLDAPGDPQSGWVKNVPVLGFDTPEVPTFIPLGPIHVARAIRGHEPLLMTAEHARHVLEIMHKIPHAAAEGCALPLVTSFGSPDG